MKMMYVKGTGALALVATLAACGPHQTVEWYSAHATERAEKVKWCVDDAARQADADCLNAMKADELARFSPATPRLQFQAPGAAPAAAASAPAASPSQSGQPMQFHFTKPAASAGGK